MSDLVEFLLARIAEDEEAARAGISSQADPENGWGYEGRALTPHVGIIHEPIQAAHITRWHPARVLAECEAKRAIVDTYVAAEEAAREWERSAVARKVNPRSVDQMSQAAGLIGVVSALKGAVRLLAFPHATHPDYDESWRP